MKYGFIGTGKMASAILRGMISGKKFKPEEINIFDIHEEVTKSMKDELSVNAYTDVFSLVKDSDVILLCVKPNVLGGVLSDIKDIVQGKLVISIAAGKTISFIEKEIGDKTPVIRVMPNINATIGEATSAYCVNKKADSSAKKTVEKIFRSVGTILQIEEKEMSMFSVLAGCSPAFTYLYINSLADAARRFGMPKDKALKIAAHSVLGSAKMILESGIHPGELIDNVCSPGGTTLEGVNELYKEGFPYVVGEAFYESYKKDLSFGKED